MVKNTQGGSKHKSQARKNSVITNNVVVQPNGPDECFAHVTKMFGNGMCQVETHCDKKLSLVCHIRGKFRGKNKKHNTVSLNSILIVGLRSWETELKNCDLISISNSSFSSSSSDTDLIEFNHSSSFDTSLNSSFQHHLIIDDI